MTNNNHGKLDKIEYWVTVTMSMIPFSRVSSEVIGWMTVWASKIARVRVQVKAGIT